MKAGRGGDKPRSSRSGAIAQLGERLHGMQEVRGSTPLGSTIFLPDNSGDFYAVFSVSSLIPAAPNNVPITISNGRRIFRYAATADRVENRQA